MIFSNPEIVTLFQVQNFLFISEKLTLIISIKKLLLSIIQFPVQKNSTFSTRNNKLFSCSCIKRLFSSLHLLSKKKSKIFPPRKPNPTQNKKKAKSVVNLV